MKNFARKKRLWFLVLTPLLLAILVAGWFFVWKAPEDSAREKSREALLSRIRTHSVTQEAYWRQFAESDALQSLRSKIRMAPPELIEFLRLDNEFQGWEGRPVPVSMDDEIAHDLQEAMEALPDGVQKLLRRKLVGLFLVRDLGGSGYMNAVMSSTGAETKGFIVFDADALNRKANEWATWKENSPFFDDGSEFRIEAQIEKPELDNRVSALQFILLHEIGHLLGVGRQEMPAISRPMRLGELIFLAYGNLSWVQKDEAVFSRFDPSEFPLRKKIFYYAEQGQGLASSKIKDVYNELEQTDFPSLYGATSVYDDFAEGFATYVHTQIQKKPWSIQILQGREVRKTIESCWDQPRCAGKREILEKILRDEGILE